MHLIKTIYDINLKTLKFEDTLHDSKMLNAKTLINSFNYTKNLKLSAYEFKVFSQWGDDGIIQYLINTIDIPNKTFIEFGVEYYVEANTKFLLMNNNWSGYIIDGLKENIDKITNSDIYWKYDLIAKEAFITRDNIKLLIDESMIAENLGILSIDIDGNDYWIWKCLDIKPIIVISEYNSVFKNNPWTIPYQKDFVRTNAHHTNLYYGSSLQSLIDLANSKGYSLVGCNSAGNNAYFIRNDKLGNIKSLSFEEAFVDAKFKEGRTRDGGLSYVSGLSRIEQIKGMSVFNTQTEQIQII